MWLCLCECEYVFVCVIVLNLELQIKISCPSSSVRALATLIAVPHSDLGAGRLVAMVDIDEIIRFILRVFAFPEFQSIKSVYVILNNFILFNFLFLQYK